MRPDAMMDATEMVEAVYEHGLDDSEEWLAFLKETEARAKNVRRERVGLGFSQARALQALGGTTTLRGSEADLWCYELHRANERNIETKLLKAHDAVCALLRVSGYDLPEYVAERLDLQA